MKYQLRLKCDASIKRPRHETKRKSVRHPHRSSYKRLKMIRKAHPCRLLDRKRRQTQRALLQMRADCE